MSLFYWLDSNAWFQAVLIEKASRWNAAAASLILSLLGLALKQEGSALVSASGSVEIANSCTGSFVFLSFAAAVIPFPAPWKARLKGLLGGFAVLTTVNLFRIALIVLVTSRFPEALWTFHVILGQIIVITGMLSFFLWWIKQSENPDFFSFTRSSRKMFKVLLLFIVGYAAGYWLYALFLKSVPGLLIKEMIGRHATHLTSAAKIFFTVSGSDDAPPAIELIDGCLSSPMIVFFAAVIFAWPGDWKKKLLIIVLGFIPFFYGYHLLRAVLIFATLGLQPRETNMAYHLYGQVMLALFLLLLIAAPRPDHAKSRSDDSWGWRLLTGLVSGLVLGMGVFYLSENISPILTHTITGLPQLSRDPQQTISLMPFLQTFIWTALMGISPGLTPARKGIGIVLGALGVILVFAGVVVFLEIFQLSPHVGMAKLGVVLAPFLIYGLLLATCRLPSQKDGKRPSCP